MKFYAINTHRFDDRTFAYGEELGLETGQNQKCKACGSAISDREWLPPLRVKLSQPSYGDFVFGTFSTFLVSDRFNTEYLKSGLTCIQKFAPVEVVKVSRKQTTSLESPQYYYITIIKSCTRVDEVLSKFIWKREPTCDICRSGIIKLWEGVYIQQATWNNEDIFFPMNLSVEVVSERFYRFVRKHEFTNIHFLPAEEYKRDFYPEK